LAIPAGSFPNAVTNAVDVDPSAVFRMFPKSWLHDLSPAEPETYPWAGSDSVAAIKVCVCLTAARQRPSLQAQVPVQPPMLPAKIVSS
jgi:hypothetical protein